MTCALLAVARDEDRFIDEWVNYHLELGFDHIYICDNNDIDKPLVVDNDKVTIFGYRGIDFSKNNYSAQKNSIQSIIYTNALSQIDTLYDYCAICDIDEFFDFKGYKLKEFIEEFIIKIEKTFIVLPWVTYTDNGLVHRKKGLVQDLYTEICTKMPFEYGQNECSWGKSIFKLTKNIKYDVHEPNHQSMPICEYYHLYENLYYNDNGSCVRHYRTKCLEDYLEHKVKNQHFGKVLASKGNIIKTYFLFNDFTMEKLFFIFDFYKKNKMKLTIVDKRFIAEQIKRDKIKYIAFNEYSSTPQKYYIFKR